MPNRWMALKFALLPLRRRILAMAFAYLHAYRHIDPGSKQFMLDHNRLCRRQLVIRGPKDRRIRPVRAARALALARGDLSDQGWGDTTKIHRIGTGR